MTEDLDPRLELSEQAHALLLETPAGLSEYALIQLLKERHSSHIPNLPLTDKLVLFRTHFLVFNALYILRDQLWAEQSGALLISPLHIELQAYSSGARALSEHDPLREYYLDLNNLRDTDEAEVEKLLTSFWTRIRGGDEKIAALELFELHEAKHALDLSTIKHRYRQLVSQHHPDRGGNTERLQTINKAMEILQRYYS